MTSRQLTRVVQQVFDRAYDEMRQAEGEDSAHKLKEASTHWLRHTGASMEIERGRALKDLSEDLGHSVWPQPILFMSIQRAKFGLKAGSNAA